MTKYGYIRVSCKDQDVKSQVDAILNKTVKEENIYIDKMIGKTIDRPEWSKLMQTIGVKDTIVIKELDRLGRKTKVIEESYALLKKKGVYLEVIENELLSTYGKSDTELNLIQPLVIQVLAYMAQKEREETQQRQKEAYASMKKDSKGRLISNRTHKPVGRPSKIDNLTKEQDGHIVSWMDGNISTTECIKVTGISRSTLFKFKKELGE